MNLGLIFLIFAIIFVAELPDKSLFAALILSTRYAALPVWFGASAAFLVHVIIAVTAGRLLTLLPHRVVEIVVACLFLAGAAIVFFGKHSWEAEEKDLQAKKLAKDERHAFWKVFATSFGIVFIGEWGDITQIATANYAAKYDDIFDVAIGATLGLWAVTAVAIIFGNKVLKLVPPIVLQRVTGTVMLGFGLFSLFSAFH